MEPIAGRTWGAQWRIAAIATLLPMYAIAQQNVTVCVHPDALIRGQAIAGAEDLAGKAFAQAGVRVSWCHDDTTPYAIWVELSESAPSDFHPGALAFALPYEGVHITVFYDRIRKNYPANLGTAVLGHVLVHEIAHMLQGVDRHSKSGVMKAHWTSGDLIAMASKPLPFTAEDIELIQSGLAARNQSGPAPGQVAEHRVNLSASALFRPQMTVPGGGNEQSSLKY